MGCERLSLIMELSHCKHAQIVAGAAKLARACVPALAKRVLLGILVRSAFLQRNEMLWKIKPSHARVRCLRGGESSISLGSRWKKFRLIWWGSAPPKTLAVRACYSEGGLQVTHFQKPDKVFVKAMSSCLGKPNEVNSLSIIAISWPLTDQSPFHTCPNYHHLYL